VNKARTKVNRTATELKQNETQICEIPQQNRESEHSEQRGWGGAVQKLRRSIFVGRRRPDPNATERKRTKLLLPPKSE
jgi:hypothetical protein